MSVATAAATNPHHLEHGQVLPLQREDARVGPEHLAQVPEGHELEDEPGGAGGRVGGHAQAGQDVLVVEGGRDLGLQVEVPQGGGA